MQQKREDFYQKNYNKNSVVIIGSGPCGILATKYLKENNNVICIDNREDIGGQWHFDDYNEENHPNLQQNSFFHHYGTLPSSLYENLQANIPKYLMTFKGFPSKAEYQEFMKAEEFQQYLQDYCAYHNLKQYMLFKKFVSSVKLVKNLNADEKEKAAFTLDKKFLIEIKDAENYMESIRYLQADNVIVATGHYSVPNYPKISDLQLFKGIQLHSHYFRQKHIKKFTGKHIVIYGTSMSAQDLLYIILQQTDASLQPKKVSVIGNQMAIDRLRQSEAYKDEINCSKLGLLPTYIQKVLNEKSLILESGEKVEDVDVILYATGYQYSFPFLENQIDNLIEFVPENERKNSCGPLYKRIFSVKEPNLIFLGLTYNTISIQQIFERQAIIAQRFIDKLITLPCQEDMLKDYQEDFKQSQSKFVDGRDYLKVSYFAGLNEIEYSKQLSELAGMQLDEQFNKYIKEIYVPISVNLLQKGNYPQMKQQQISHLLPLNYNPDEALF
ncbi:hypothetical protein ABPG72_008291 [Tetrahymena utriculariae]